MKKNALKLLGVVLVLLALALRLYRISATQTFLEDEGRDLLIVKYMVDNKKPVLLGPQTSTGNMYLGPFYYYFITPALLLSNFDPIGPAILIAITGAITVALMYIFMTRSFGVVAGIVSALLYAIMPLPVMFTRNSWNPNLVPLISLLVVWVVYNMLFSNTKTKRSKNTNFAILGLLLGILVQLHYMTLILFPYIAFVILMYETGLASIKDIKNIKRKLNKEVILDLLTNALYATGAFITSLSPFIVFEFRNKFVNLNAITRFLEAKDEKNIRYSMPIDLLVRKVSSTFSKLIDGLLGRGAFQSIDPFATHITVGFLIILVFLLLFSNNQQSNKKTHSTNKLTQKTLFLLGFLVIPILSLGIYQENIHLHYLGFLFPAVYILLALSISLTKKPASIIAAIYMVAVLSYSIPTTVSYISSGPSFQTTKAREVAKYISEDAGDRQYNIVSRGDTSSTPYQYFLSISKNPPTNDLTNTLYLICQDRPCSKDDINFDLLFIQGPAHPYLKNYVGRPVILYFSNKRELLKQKHISHGVWVAKIRVKLNE